MEKGLLQESFQLPKSCLSYSFQLEIIGYAGTNTILTDLDVDRGQLQNYLPVIPKLKVNIFENTLQIDVTHHGCNGGYLFMVTTDSLCHQNQNCLTLESEYKDSVDLSENVEDFRSNDGGHISLNIGNSAKIIHACETF